ncbi:MAG: hypothetical protein N3C62_01430 [Synergistetes bacterium]|nr:hypothetical protein [Synergistota bacterium]MCX8127401.1 hypothetical protein [Synergistota bacterium]MDW8192265.1 SpoIVB peptidase S55 domain-containing protein [Synergistota bacterium]
MFLKRVCIFIFLLFFFSCSYALCIEIMPLKEVKPGMIGEVRTVFKGIEVRSFPVEVISVIKSSRGDRHFILIRAYGPLIEKLGGIAAGMSGSPVYIKGKIIGAIGYGWKMSDHRLGLVTPIEEMIRVWDKKYLPENLNWDVILRERRSEENPETEEKEKIVMIASGLSPRGFSMISSDFERYGVRFVSVPISGEIKVARDVKLVPGAAVGALLSCGDINIGAIGTLSYLDGDKFLAFAHPFMLRGNVNYFLTTAYIHECISSIEFPFKLGTPGDIVGVVTQDRIEAIGGVLRRYPLSIPISFYVKSLDEGKERKSFVRVVYDDGILDKLLKAIFLSTFDLGWGRVGDGTVKLKYKLEGRNIPYVVERTNYFYSGEDVSKEAFEAFKRDFFLILYNEFAEVFPLGVTIEAEFTAQPKVLWIKDVKVAKKEISRGEELIVKVKLLPYRGKGTEKEVKLRIPEDFPQGKAILMVRGGGIYPQGKNKGDKKEEKVYKNLKDLLDDLRKEENNNEVIVEIVSSGDRANAQDKEGKGKLNSKDEENDESVENNEDLEESEDEQNREKKHQVKVVFDTDFYVEGYIEKEVNIK